MPEVACCWLQVHRFRYGHVSVTIRQGALQDGLGARVWAIAHTMCRWDGNLWDSPIYLLILLGMRLRNDSPLVKINPMHSMSYLLWCRVAALLVQIGSVL